MCNNNKNDCCGISCTSVPPILRLEFHGLVRVFWVLGLVSSM